MIAIGSFGRMTIPLFMTPIYNKWGLYALGMVCEIAMAITFVLVLSVYKDLVPLEMAAERKKMEAEANQMGN